MKGESSVSVKGAERTWIVQSEVEAGGWREGHIAESRMKGVGCRGFETEG